MICHDGSYMKKFTSNVCSMALIMHCTAIGFELTCTWTQCFDEADNNRDDYLGLCWSHVLFRFRTSRNYNLTYLLLNSTWFYEGTGTGISPTSTKHGSDRPISSVADTAALALPVEAMAP